jgi:Tol biopolymer transport system component
MVPLPGCWHPDGQNILIALMDRQTRKSSIWKVSKEGRQQQQIPVPHEKFYRYLAISPDGSLLIYAVMENGFLGLYIMPAEGGLALPISVTPNYHSEGVTWALDGKRIAFSKGSQGESDIWIMELDIDELKKKLRMLDN